MTIDTQKVVRDLQWGPLTPELAQQAAEAIGLLQAALAGSQAAWAAARQRVADPVGTFISTPNTYIVRGKKIVLDP